MSNEFPPRSSWTLGDLRALLNSVPASWDALPAAVVTTAGTLPVTAVDVEHALRMHAVPGP